MTFHFDIYCRSPSATAVHHRPLRALADYRRQAFDCCRVCLSDWLKRQGDLRVETEDPARSRHFLQLSAGVLG